MRVEQKEQSMPDKNADGVSPEGVPFEYVVEKVGASQRHHHLQKAS